MRKSILSVAFGAVLGLSACQTQYGDMKFNQGVSAERMTDSSFRITAKGNGYTDGNQIIDFLALKAAETTIANGFTHFVVTAGEDISKREVGVTPGYVIGSVYVPSQVYENTIPGGYVIIQCGAFPSGAAPQGAADAAEIIRNIGPRIYAAGKLQKAS